MDPRMEQWLKFRPAPRTQVQPVQSNSPSEYNNHIFRQSPQKNQWQSKKEPVARKGCCGGGNRAK